MSDIRCVSEDDTFVPPPLSPPSAVLALIGGLLARELTFIHLFAFLVLLDDLSTQVNKNLIDIAPRLSRRFEVRFLPRLSQLEGSGSLNHAIVLAHIAFVAHDDNWNVLVVFDADDGFA